jgi:hypothetical protein
MATLLIWSAKSSFGLILEYEKEAKIARKVAQTGKNQFDPPEM